MRAIWSGSISFGLVNIPVRLYSPTSESHLDFDMLHAKDLSPIRYARICREDGKEIPYEEIVKGYEYRKGDYVVLVDEDFKKANVKKTKSIDIVEFVDEKEIDPIYLEKPYYLEPEKGAEKAYALLREGLKRSKKVGIAKFVLRTKEILGAIRPEGNAIVLDQMRYGSEIKRPTELHLPAGKGATGREIEMALKLIDQLSGHFKIEEFKDTYTEDLKAVIARKAKGKKPAAKGKAPKPTKVKDLMSTLKASLEKEHQKVRA